MTKEQEALNELKDNGFTVVKNHSSKWGDEWILKKSIIIKNEIA